MMQRLSVLARRLMDVAMLVRDRRRRLCHFDAVLHPCLRLRAMAARLLTKRKAERRAATEGEGLSACSIASTCRL